MARSADNALFRALGIDAANASAAADTDAAMTLADLPEPVIRLPGADTSIWQTTAAQAPQTDLENLLFLCGDGSPIVDSDGDGMSDFD